MTTEMTDRDWDVEYFYNLYKDVNGIKPRHMDLYSLTDEEFKAELDDLCKEHDEMMREELKEREQEALIKAECNQPTPLVNRPFQSLLTLN